MGNQSFSNYLASADVGTGGFNCTTPTAISADGLRIGVVAWVARRRRPIRLD